MGCLSDPKPEVRAIATATLAGMIKGMGEVEAATLRVEALAKARGLLAAGGTKRAAPQTPAVAPDAATLLLKHGAVLVGVVIMCLVTQCAIEPFLCCPTRVFCSRHPC